VYRCREVGFERGGLDAEGHGGSEDGTNPVA
jgi:hypothetical protein